MTTTHDYDCAYNFGHDCDCTGPRSFHRASWKDYCDRNLKEETPIMHIDFIDYGTPEDKVLEECGEVIQAICKIKRFGIDSRNPLILGSITNREHLLLEIADLHYALDKYHASIKGDFPLLSDDILKKVKLLDPEGDWKVEEGRNYWVLSITLGKRIAWATFNGQPYNLDTTIRWLREEVERPAP